MCLPSCMAPIDSQLSSISLRSCSSHIFFISVKSQLFPKRLTGIIAQVSGVIASLIFVTSMFHVLGSTSTKFSLNPFCATGKYVVAQPTTGTMMSPFNLYFHFNKLNINKLALDPELTITACGDPKYSANSCSNCFTCLPMVYMSVSMTRCIASTSSVPHVENASGYLIMMFSSLL